MRAGTGAAHAARFAPPRTRAVRVVVADDESLFVEALTTMLDLDERIEVVGRARDGLEALRLAATERPDVILMDLDMPRINGLGATRRLRIDYPSIRVAIVTGSTSSEDVERAREAGAVAYVTKDRVGTELSDVLVEIAALTPSFAASEGRGIPGPLVRSAAGPPNGSS